MEWLIFCFPDIAQLLFHCMLLCNDLSADMFYVDLFAFSNAVLFGAMWLDGHYYYYVCRPGLFEFARLDLPRCAPPNATWTDWKTFNLSVSIFRSPFHVFPYSPTYLRTAYYNTYFLSDHVFIIDRNIANDRFARFFYFMTIWKKNS